MSRSAEAQDSEACPFDRVIAAVGYSLDERHEDSLAPCFVNDRFEIRAMCYQGAALDNEVLPSEMTQFRPMLLQPGDLFISPKATASSSSDASGRFRGRMPAYKPRHGSLHQGPTVVS